MRHNNRKFNKESYLSNDKRAKDAMIEYLTKEGYTDIIAKEDYYFDISAKKEKDYFFEVEIKNQWGDKWNPSWKEIRIPERKKRLIKKLKEEYPTYNLIFVVFNTDCTQAWFIDGDTVDKSKVGTIQNSWRTNAPHLNEPFFHIEKEKANLIKIKG
jgi:hypothetical protein